MTRDEVIALAKQDAADAIEIARREPGPVTWITGNNFMPPLRAFGHAETVWEADYMDHRSPNHDDQYLWEDYFEEFTQELEANDVLLDAPDYDNALYVVDLRRWQYCDDGELHETLDGEWEAIEGD